MVVRDKSQRIRVVLLMLRVLVACEYSGRVRDAFTRMGHFAMSCDLLPSDARELIEKGRKEARA